MASILDGVTYEDLRFLIDSNPYLRGYLQGYLAELMLMRDLEKLPGVTSVTKIPDHDLRKGDLEVVFNGTPITVECKSVRTSTVKEEPVHDSWTASVSIKNTDKRQFTCAGKEITSTNLVKGTFDILAISCFAVNGTWSFLFIENQYLSESPEVPGMIPTNLQIEPGVTPCLTSDIHAILSKVSAEKSALTC
jgi:hypothetical protein